MNYQKLTNYLVVVLGLLGLGLLLAILVQGDDTIEMNALQGDFGSVSFIIYLACQSSFRYPIPLTNFAESFAKTGHNFGEFSSYIKVAFSRNFPKAGFVP